MKKIFVAGHNGMVGSAIVRQLAKRSDIEIITCSRKALDLTSQAAVQAFFAEQNIDEVYLAAAKVGGIIANNTYPADFIYENLMIEANIIHAAHVNDVQRLLFLGSSCIYPKLAAQPMAEHHEAKLANTPEVAAWGSGAPMREFLHVDDMAAASIFVMELDKATYAANTEPMLSHINVGTGVDCTIKQLTETVAKVVGYNGKIVWDTTKPDGAPRKLMNVERLKALGWQYSIELEQGLNNAYQWFLANQDNFRA